MKTSFKALTAALLLGSTALAPAAFAQDATTATPPAATGTEAPAATPVAPDATTGAAGTANTTADAATSGTATYLTAQAENHISVDDFMDEAIYTADNESIGNVKDLLVERDGGIVAAVVGVGGFLGIGEKDVAIPFDNISITREEAEADGEPGDARLTTTETAESLRNAPEFMSLDDQADDAAASTTMTPATDSSTTSSTTAQ
ncbi:PRC-barrel domain-containing protein [Peteryoungia ipomoeae]|uniref:PRC-barrel domain containing protein n=1 Tax=Peteryoungia ipomoeae TaxID=1210932 RepID=A0A4S8P017_9HYPH|nr:PRC-barrel domain-containing protein [Peteryoungia ipomoeae]THV23258.1 PRC-barrel domain containing protein [Peteryoungia ipomoeae]